MQGPWDESSHGRPKTVQPLCNRADAKCRLNISVSFVKGAMAFGRDATRRREKVNGPAERPQRIFGTSYFLYVLKVGVYDQRSRCN